MKIKTKFSVILMAISVSFCVAKEIKKREPLPLRFSINEKEYLAYDSLWSENPIMEIKKDWPMHDHDFSLLIKNNNRFTYSNPNYTIIHGLDISSHNKKINFKKVKKDGWDFVFLRIAFRRYGYETGYLEKDRFFDENFAKAKKAGLKIGVYVFSQAINEEEALEEAQIVIDSLNPKDLELPVAFDPEIIANDDARTDNVTGETFTKNAIAFCQKIRQAGFKPIVYANIYFEDVYFDLATFAEYDIPIWYADYKDKPQTPYDFEFWQYSDYGKVKGIKKKAVDHNLWFIKNEQQSP